jgi:SAM-dependent methyltransferase
VRVVWRKQIRFQPSLSNEFVMNKSKRSRTLYDAEFYADQAVNSFESARIVAALVHELIKPESVVDIGCGLGGWLKAFSELGARRVRGVDGDYVDKSKLYIDSSSFTAINLSEPFEIREKYDLAISLEVAEHVPSAAGERLVKACTNAAGVVLFSAAVPGQGGTGHINEQWPEYWKDQFKEAGFAMIDALRGKIRDDPRIKWWYRQNLVLFANADSSRRYPALQPGAESAAPAIEWVHVNMLREAGVRNLSRHFRPALRDALQRRVARFRARIGGAIRGTSKPSCSS